MGPSEPDLQTMYARLASLYRRLIELLDRAGTIMSPHDALTMDGLEAHAAELRARIKEAEDHYDGDID